MSKYINNTGGPRYPRSFYLQINNIPRGPVDTVYGNGLFSEVHNPTYIVQGLLID